MVVLRLARKGKKKQAFYRLVVADSQRFVNSKFISIVGWYNPATKEVSLKKDEVMEWLGKGAQPSNTVAKLLKDNGIKLPDWVKITEKVRKPKKEAPEPKAANAEAAPKDTETEEAPEAAEATDTDTQTEESAEDEKAVEAPAEETTPEEAPTETNEAVEAVAEETEGAAEEEKADEK